MSQSPGRFPWLAVLSAILLLALCVSMYYLPLRPTAWGGPRGAGPFEVDPTATHDSWPLTHSNGRWTRNARIGLEEVAKLLSPDRPIEATAEALTSYHASLIVARLVVLWFILWGVSRTSWLATLFTIGVALPLYFGAPRHDDGDLGLLLFVILMAATTPARPPWIVVLVAIPGLFAIWANAHASILTGLAWLGVTTAGRAIQWWKSPADLTRPSVFRYLIAIALSLAAVCANADGPRIYLDAVLSVKDANLRSITGWQPIDFSTNEGMPWVFFGSIALLLLVQVVGSRPFSPTNLLVVLSFGMWAIVQQRGLSYWWLIAAWLIVPELARIPAIEFRTSVRSRHWKWFVFVGVLLAFLATPWARWLISGKPRDLDAIVTKETPVALARELTGTEALPELRETLLASYPNGRFRGAILCGKDQGDFLAWVLDGDLDRPVMMYSRPELLDPMYWTECHRVLDGESDWWEITSRHQVNLIAIEPRRYQKLAERLRKAKEWRTVQDDDLLIAVRREPRLPVDPIQP